MSALHKVVVPKLFLNLNHDIGPGLDVVLKIYYGKLVTKLNFVLRSWCCVMHLSVIPMPFSVHLIELNKPRSWSRLYGFVCSSQSADSALNISPLTIKNILRWQSKTGSLAVESAVGFAPFTASSIYPGPWAERAAHQLTRCHCQAWRSSFSSSKLYLHESLLGGQYVGMTENVKFVELDCYL